MRGKEIEPRIALSLVGLAPVIATVHPNEQLRQPHLYGLASAWLRRRDGGPSVSTRIKPLSSNRLMARSSASFVRSFPQIGEKFKAEPAMLEIKIHPRKWAWALGLYRGTP